MDSNTLNYYDRIDDTFTVVPVQDIEVKSNSNIWTNAYKDADLIFVTSLSSEMFNESRDEFCKNLAVVLTKTKGIVFAGNSSISDTLFGCPYTSYFNFSSSSNNLELKNNTVKLIRSHQITDGYNINESYNVSIQDTIYTIPSPVDGIILGTVYGDPDGLGPTTTGDYPFLVVWNEVGYRSAVWGINTSTLTDCSGCLGWRLFNQLLEWVSNTSDIGYKISTNKRDYYPEERINIYVKSPATISTISGRIYYPNGENYALSFSGSEKDWSSIYLINKEVPNGNYTIEVIVDKVKKNTSVVVKAFDLNLFIDNSTEKVRIKINATDLNKNIVNVNLTVNIISPKGERSDYYFEKNGSVSFDYDIQSSGRYTINATAIDDYKRNITESKSFYYFFKPNITIVPQNMSKIVYEPTNFSISISIFNNGTNNVTNSYIIKTGNTKDWVELENTSLGVIEPNKSKTFRLNISIPDVDRGTYNGTIKFSFDGNEYQFYIFITRKYLGNLSVNPVHWSAWIPKGQSRTTKFFMSNGGRGEVTIESINVIGDLKDKITITQQPSQVEPGLNRSLEIEVYTTDVSVTDLVTTLTGEIEIETDQGVYSQPISLEVKVVEDLTVKAQDLSNDLIVLENNITILSKSVDVSSLKNNLMSIKSDLNEIENLYSQGDYQNAIDLYKSAKTDTGHLRMNINQIHEEIKDKEKMFTMFISIFIVLIVIGVLVFFVFRKMQEKVRYSWLYKKWKGRKNYS
jgi:hypothetical protein